MTCEILYDRHVGRELKRLDNVIQSIMHCGMAEKEQDLTRMQCWIIGYLYRHGEEEVFQRDIEAAFSIARSTATGILQLMEKKGYILRKSVERDARLKQLILTPKGVDLEETTIRNVNLMESRLREGLSQEEIDTFFSVIQKMRSNLERDRSENDRRRDRC